MKVKMDFSDMVSVTPWAQRYYSIRTLIVLTLIACGWLTVPIMGQTETEIQTPETKGVAESSQNVRLDDNDEAPGLGVFAAFVGVLFLLTIGAGAMLTVVLLGLAAGLIALGILTTSTLAGLHTKQPGNAVKAFILQLGGILGVLTGAGIAFLAVMLCNIQLPNGSIIIAGALIGLTVGIGLGILLNLAWEKILKLLIDHFGELSEY